MRVAQQEQASSPLGCHHLPASVVFPVTAALDLLLLGATSAAAAAACTNLRVLNRLVSEAAHDHLLITCASKSSLWLTQATESSGVQQSPRFCWNALQHSPWLLLLLNCTHQRGSGRVRQLARAHQALHVSVKNRFIVKSRCIVADKCRSDPHCRPLSL